MKMHSKGQSLRKLPSSQYKMGEGKKRDGNIKRSGPLLAGGFNIKSGVEPRPVISSTFPLSVEQEFPCGR